MCGTINVLFDLLIGLSYNTLFCSFQSSFSPLANSQKHPTLENVITVMFDSHFFIFGAL